MKQRSLGGNGPSVSAIGLGCMTMAHAEGSPERSGAVETIRNALDAGITLIDTGDFYSSGRNEALIADALRGVPRDSYRLSVKFGGMVDPAGNIIGMDARPAALKNFLAYSLNRLKVDYIDVYRPARLDVTVPIEETMGALADCVHKGWIRHIGLSEVGAETLRRAAAVHPVADLQIEYSLLSRGIEAAILPTCRELGIAITAYGVLARGLLSSRSQTYDPADKRLASPRFQGLNLEANLALAGRLKDVADNKGVTVEQAAVAWALAQGEDIIPVIGARRPDQLARILPSVDVALTSADLAAIEQAVPKGSAKGARVPEALLRFLDSER